jgi:hypothetical protein
MMKVRWTDGMMKVDRAGMMKLDRWDDEGGQVG